MAVDVRCSYQHEPHQPLSWVNLNVGESSRPMIPVGLDSTASTVTGEAAGRSRRVEHPVRSNTTINSTDGYSDLRTAPRSYFSTPRKKCRIAAFVASGLSINVRCPASGMVAMREPVRAPA
jgi:hypothetical protein